MRERIVNALIYSGLLALIGVFVTLLGIFFVPSFTIKELIIPVFAIIGCLYGLQSPRCPYIIPKSKPPNDGEIQPDNDRWEGLS